MVNGVLSDPAPVESGVPQGSVTIPHSHWNQNIAHSFVSSFADDTRLLREVKGVRDVSALQSDLETVYEWAVDNNASFSDIGMEVMKH